MRILTVYDNKSCAKGLKSGWGFACVVDERVMFDTGGEGSTLISNMRALNVDLSKIEALVLSHEHWDHIGGVFALLDEIRSSVGTAPRIFIPASFSSGFKERLREYTNEIIEVQPEEPVEISENVFSTGELGTWTKEQSLVLKTSEGLAVVTGCAHPGIVNILRFVKERFKDEIAIAIGGFHLGFKDVTKAFRKIGVKKVAPCHCTGEIATALLKREYQENFIENCAGNAIEIGD